MAFWVSFVQESSLCMYWLLRGKEGVEREGGCYDCVCCIHCWFFPYLLTRV